MPVHQQGIDIPSGGVSPRRSLAIWIWSALLVADVVLVTRRLSGEFSTPLPGSLAFLSCVIVSAACWIAWFLYTISVVSSQINVSQRFIPQGFSVVLALLWTWSISVGASPLTFGILLGVVVTLVVAVTAQDTGAMPADFARTIQDFFESGQSSRPSPPVIEAASPPVIETPSAAEFEGASLPVFAADSAVLQFRDDLDPRPADVSTGISRGVAMEQRATEQSGHDVDNCDADESEVEPDDNLTLWLSRRVTDDGEQIEGWVRARFEAGQRETVIHVAFCPPLSGIPELETEDLEGADLEIRIAAVFAFGARLSIRKSNVADDIETHRIGFIALSKSAIRAA
jgi:hypothetical protein